MPSVRTAHTHAGPDLQRDPRAREDAVLARCEAAARGALGQAADASEASLFLLAAALLPARYEANSQRLRSAAQPYETAGATVDAGEVVRRGWIVSLPRFRHGLAERLARAPS